MPEATPYTTANELLAYKGDPGLAAGASNGLSPLTSNPLVGVDTTLDRIQENQGKMNVLKYQQKQKQQEDLANEMASTGFSVFNMKGQGGKNMSFSPLPEDQKILTDKAKELRQLILSNPGKYKYDKNYYDKKSEYDQLVNHAGLRSNAYMQYNQEAATSNDPEERQNIQSWRDMNVTGVPLTEGKLPEPYMPKPTSDPELFIPSKDLNEKNYGTFQQRSGKDANGNLVYTSMEGLNDNTLDFRGKLTPGSKGFVSAANMTRDYLSHVARDPQAVITHNKNIDAINIARGYVNDAGQPVSPHYIPHIAEVAAGPDGQPVVSVNKNVTPADVAYSLMAEKVGALQPSRQIKKSADELETADLAQEKTKLDIQHTRKTIDQMDDKLRMEQEKLDSEKDKKSKEDYKQELSAIGAKRKANTVVSIMTRYAGNPALRKTNPIEADQAGTYEEIKKAGFDAKGYKALTVPITTDIISMGGEPNVTSATSGEKNIAGSLTPAKVYFLQSPDGNPLNSRFAYKYEEMEGKKKVPRWKIVDAPQAIDGMVSHSENYKGDKTYDHDISRQYFEDNFGANKGQSENTPTKKATPAVQDEETIIMARLKPARLKKPDGTMIDIMIDPVTKKRYAKQ